MSNKESTRKINVELIISFMLSARLIEYLLEALVSGNPILYKYMVFVSPIDWIIYLGGFILLTIDYFTNDNIERVKYHSLLKMICLIAGMAVIYYGWSYTNTYIESTFSTAFNLILIQGPIFFYAGSFSIDYEKLFRHMQWWIIVAIFYGFIATIVVESDYMTMSNIVLVYGLLAYHLYKRTNKRRYLIGFLCIGGLVLFGGSRGNLLWLIVFYMLYNLMFFKGVTKRSVIFSLSLIMGGLVVILFRDQIFDILLSIFPNSRTVSLIAESSFSNDSFRSNIWNYFIGEIKQNPFKFRGFFSDRAAINSTFLGTNKLGYWITETRSFSYAHNLFLEIIFDFGIFWGGIISLKILSLLFGVLRSAQLSDDYDRNAFYLMVAIIGFFMLMISESYLQNVYFWFFIGSAIQIPRRTRFKIGSWTL